MLKAKRQGPLYRRGQYTLDWHRRRDGTLRTPFLTVFWYDPPPSRCGRSASTGTADLQEAKTWLDAFYLEQTTGEAVCKACGRPYERSAGYLVTDAMTAYQTLHGDRLPSAGAIAARLMHIVDYIGTLPSLAVTCETIDEAWVGRFRQWAEAQPIVSPKGGTRLRSLSTIEGSVAQLSAAINHAYRRGDTTGPARFKAQPIRELNQTPRHRSAVAELAEMFRYCVAPEADTAEMHKRLVRERASLHRFLIASVATLSRPDAAHDISTDPKRRQWSSKARILDLNPKGRRQTKKYRAIVPIAWQVAHHFDASAKGFFVGPKSVRTAWEGMAAHIELPDQGEGGMKLIRRSMGDLLRQRLPEEAWGEISMFMGHDRTDQVTSLYAPFSPRYLKRALAEIEAIVDEIEALAPGAFALPDSNVVTIGRKA